MPKERLDVLVAKRGLASSREKAQRLIRAGKVKVDGQMASKPGHQFADDADVEVAEGPRFASRGGEKLECAFEHFALSVDGMTCMDVGASTGGFTDCLLQHGAAKVYAVDVGKGLLDWTLRNDDRVVVVESVNARYLNGGMFPDVMQCVVIDVSFISLTKILPAVTELLAPDGYLVSLVKPQFEAGRKHVGRGGVVRDEAVREEVLAKIRAFGTEELELTWIGQCESSLHGPAGNIESLVYWQKQMRQEEE